MTTHIPYKMFECPSREEMMDKAIGLSAFLVSCCLFFGLGYMSDRRDVSKFADTNRDEIVSTDEWWAVYEEVGAKYDPPNMVGLNWSQINRYLENHDPEKIKRRKLQEEQERTIRFSRGK